MRHIAQQVGKSVVAKLGKGLIKRNDGDKQCIGRERPATDQPEKLAYTKDLEAMLLTKDVRAYCERAISKPVTSSNTFSAENNTLLRGRIIKQNSIKNATFIECK